MHELSLAQGILDIVNDHVLQEQTSNVRRVQVLVGHLSGVVAESLEFCYSALVAETPLAESRLVVKHVPVRVQCPRCDDTFDVDQDVFVCPSCGSNQTKIVSGTELYVAEIELEEPAEAI